MRHLTLLYRSVFVVFPIVAGAGAAVAQPSTYTGAEYTEPVVPDIFNRDLRDLPRAPQWRPGDPIKEIPKRRELPAGPLPAEPPEPRLDPLLEIQEDALRDTEERTFTTPLLNFNGQGFTGVNPPDTVGDVGPDHYIQVINSGGGSQFTVYNKSTGAVIAGPLTVDNLGTGNCANGLGDPIVLYDPLADRWLLSEFSSAGNRLCVYISQGPDPVSSGWFAYQFTAPNFPDYPKYSVWPDAYYVTSNEPGPSAVYALQRSQMLVGNAASLQRMTVPDLAGFGFQALTPADLDGATAPPANSPAFFMRHRDDEIHNVGANNPTQDFLELWEFDVDFATPANTSLTGPTTIAVAEFDSTLCGQFSFNCFPQPGSSITLDPLREVIMHRLQYRNFGTYETLVGNFVTDVTGTDRGGIRWFELRKSGGPWTVEQQGTYSPNAVNRWMGAISMDGDGNIALGYNVSNSTSVFPGVRYTGRLAVDTPGTMTQIETTLIAGTAANASNRYGDYSAMSVDPDDDCTFWFTGEHNPALAWSTRIGSFKFDSCGGTGGDPSCSGTAVVIQNRVFNVDTNCVATTSLSANSAVSITSGAAVIFQSPQINLGPGFSVATGSVLKAGN